MTPPVSPIRQPFDIPYETGFPLSEGFRGLSDTSFFGRIGRENGSDLTDGLTDSSAVKIPRTDLIR